MPVRFKDVEVIEFPIIAGPLHPSNFSDDERDDISSTKTRRPLTDTASITIDWKAQSRTTVDFEVFEDTREMRPLKKLFLPRTARKRILKKQGEYTSDSEDENDKRKKNKKRESRKDVSKDRRRRRRPASIRIKPPITPPESTPPALDRFAPPERRSSDRFAPPESRSSDRFAPPSTRSSGLGSGPRRQASWGIDVKGLGNGPMRRPSANVGGIPMPLRRTSSDRGLSAPKRRPSEDSQASKGPPPRLSFGPGQSMIKEGQNEHSESSLGSLCEQPEMMVIPRRRLSVADDRMTSRTGGLLQQADAFIRCLDIRDRRHLLSTHKSCFIGSEAVDAMVFSGVATTRIEAIEIGTKLQRELHLFRCIHGGTNGKFCDDPGAFFTLEEDNDTTKTFRGEVNLVEGVNGLVRDHPHHACDDEMIINLEPEELDAKLDVFMAIVGPLCRSRKYHLRTYNKVFVGEEAVDALVNAGFAESRKEAVFLGRLLAKNFNLFVHVANDHAFSDDFLFYRFTAESQQLTEAEAEGQEREPSIKKRTRKSLRESFVKSSLCLQGSVLKSCLDIRDRKKNMISYRSCFVGSEAVEAMLDAGLAASRKEAVDLGRTLATELRLFTCVTGSHKFKDDENLFYRLRSHDSLPFKVVDDILGDAEIEDDSRDFLPPRSPYTRSELLEKAQAFHSCLRIETRRYHFKIYKSCFVARDAVDSLVKCGVVETRKDAVLLGRMLARELGCLEHVCGEHRFQDSYLFFRWLGTANSSPTPEQLENRNKVKQNDSERNMIGVKSIFIA